MLPKAEAGLQRSAGGFEEFHWVPHSDLQFQTGSGERLADSCGCGAAKRRGVAGMRLAWAYLGTSRN